MFGDFLFCYNIIPIPLHFLMIPFYLFNSQNMTIEALMDKVLSSVLLFFLTNAIMIRAYTFIFVKMQMNKPIKVYIVLGCLKK